MLKSLLLALDASTASEAAQQTAIDLAKKKSARLMGMAVLDNASIHVIEPMPPGAAAFKRDREEARVHRAETKLQEILKPLEEKCQAAGLDFAMVRSIGDPPKEIAREARRHDLILVGTRAHFQLEAQEGPSSTLRDLAKITPRPILALPTAPSRGAGVVIAYDDSPAAARALQMFQLLGLYHDEKIHVVAIDAESDRARAQADRALQFLRQRGYEAEAVMIASTLEPHDLIIEQIEVLQPGLLVMGAHGHSGLRSLFFGSTSDHLLFKAETPVPIFVYP